MTDLIDRQAALDGIRVYVNFADWTPSVKKVLTMAVSDIADTIAKLPSAEPERKRGHWIQTREFHGIYDEFPRRAYACSVCKVAFPTDDYTVGDFRYCPNCGARMDKE